MTAEQYKTDALPVPEQGTASYRNIHQLFKKLPHGEEIHNIFPVTYTQSVYDGKTGANLEHILHQFNHIFLQFQGTPQATRNLLPKDMRRKGIMISYRDMDNNVVTETNIDESESTSDNWGLDKYWAAYGISLDQIIKIIEDYIDQFFDDTLLEQVKEYIDQYFNDTAFEEIKDYIDEYLNGTWLETIKEYLESLITETVKLNPDDLNRDSNNQIQLADRDSTNGMGYVILRKNKTFAEQVTKENTIYEIRYDYDLDGEEVTIPANCIIDCEGGALNNGTFICNNTLFRHRNNGTVILSGTYEYEIPEEQELEIATETTLGGIKAEAKTDNETVEVKIDSSTGKLYTKSGNNPDNEDLHLVEQEDKQVLQFADKEYNSDSFSGLGRVYLRKNISGGKNVLTQEMMSKANTRYIIQYDYDLNGETITVPANCVLKFEGGSLNNGSVVGNYTCIQANAYSIFNKNTNLSGTWNVETAYSEWFYPSDDDSVAINKCLSFFKDCHLLGKSYYIKNSIVLNTNNRLIGIMKNSIIRVTNAIEGGAIRMAASHGASIDGIILLNEGECEIGLYSQYATESNYITNVQIKAFNYAGIYITKCWYAKFDNILAWDSKNNLIIENSGIDGEGGAVNGISFTNCWFNHPKDEEDSHNVVINNSGHAISFNNCTIEQCKGTEASCKITELWSSITFYNCYWESAKGGLLSCEPNYAGAGVLTIIGGEYTDAIAENPMIKIGNIDKLIVIGAHLAYYQKAATYSIVSDAKINYIYGCQSGSLPNGLINATGIIVGNVGEDYRSPAYGAQASSWRTPILKAEGYRTQGELTVGISDEQNVQETAISKARFKLSGDYNANNLVLALHRKVDGELKWINGFEVGPSSCNIIEQKSYGEITNRCLRIGNHYPTTVDNGMLFQVGMGLGIADPEYFSTTYASIFLHLRDGNSFTKKDVIKIDSDSNVSFINKDGNSLNTDGTLKSKVRFVTDKSKITGTAEIFKIVEDIDLGGESITIPENRILDFQGGKIINGTIVLWDTKILPMGIDITKYVSATISGTYAEGQVLYDSTIKKMKLWNGTEWVNLDGTALTEETI